MVKIQRLFAKTNLKIPVYLLIKRLVPNGSSRFCLHHPLPLRLLREGRVQAAQQAELCFCHTVVFHAVLIGFAFEESLSSGTEYVFLKKDICPED